MKLKDGKLPFYHNIMVFQSLLRAQALRSYKFYTSQESDYGTDYRPDQDSGLNSVASVNSITIYLWHDLSLEVLCVA